MSLLNGFRVVQVGGGMAAAPADRDALGRLGIATLTAEQNLAGLAQLLALSLCQAAIVDIDWDAPENAITATERSRLGPIRETSAMAKTRKGSDSTTSMNRDNTLSTGPPKYPAVRPTITPTTTARPEATTPTSSDIRAP